MKKLTVLALVLMVGLLVSTGFSMDNQSPKNAPKTVSTATDYGNFTQYMQ